MSRIKDNITQCIQYCKFSGIEVNSFRWEVVRTSLRI